MALKRANPGSYEAPLVPWTLMSIILIVTSNLGSSRYYLSVDNFTEQSFRICLHAINSMNRRIEVEKGLTGTMAYYGLPGSITFYTVKCYSYNDEDLSKEK